jgi:hypothetical protein
MLRQYKIHANICANADSCKLILTSFSKTEKNVTNTNFEFDKLVLIDCIDSLKHCFFPLLYQEDP